MALQGAEILIYPTAIGYAKYDTEDEQQRQWMCGFPDKVAVAVVGEYVVSVFGAEDLVDTFMSHLNGIFGVQPVYDEAIQ